MLGAEAAAQPPCTAVVESPTRMIFEGRMGLGAMGSGIVAGGVALALTSHAVSNTRALKFFMVTLLVQLTLAYTPVGRSRHVRPFC